MVLTMQSPCIVRGGGGNTQSEVQEKPSGNNRLATVGVLKHVVGDEKVGVNNENPAAL